MRRRGGEGRSESCIAPLLQHCIRPSPHQRKKDKYVSLNVCAHMNLPLLTSTTDRVVGAEEEEQGGGIANPALLHTLQCPGEHSLHIFMTHNGTLVCNTLTDFLERNIISMLQSKINSIFSLGVCAAFGRWSP